mmetsp:Transcript_43313/g.101134  ORF Transcript_43313/g.101134 Transcript_43313/m.101134 type:complete len:652 (+) Transcript_43313:64-2019(+)
MGQLGGTIGLCGRDSFETCRSQSCGTRERREYEGVEAGGVVFAETIAGLNEVDQQLLLFCSRGQLAAVRWLLKLGANPSATDSNGTTGLHASCRTGNVKVVLALLELPGSSFLLAGGDSWGWTPLHVAACNGHRAVAKALLHARADPNALDVRGHRPMELCTDAATKSLLMENVVGAETLEHKSDGDAPEEPQLEELPGEPNFGAFRYEPFFVAREPMVPLTSRHHDFLGLCDRLAARCFNVHAGRGLAFLVASGAVRDRPTDMVIFWRMHRLSSEQMGSYLSEDFALARLLRMEFLNSIRLVNTGVMSALCSAFSEISLPLDLQRLNRMTWSLAEVWVRQHSRAHAAGFWEDMPAFRSGEITGPALWKCLADTDTLHQLFFSAILLHWNLHAPLPDSQRVKFREWVDMHRVGSTQMVPRTILEPVFEMLQRCSWKPLELVTQPASSTPEDEEGPKALFDGLASVQGWVHPTYDGLMTQLEYINGAEQEQIQKALGYLSEGSFSARPPRPAREPHQTTPGKNDAEAIVSAALDPLPSTVSPRAWASLSGPLLFLAFDEVSCPFAFLYLGEVELADINPGRALFSLAAAGSGSQKELKMVLLLPDGRWHTCSLEKLVLQVADVRKLKDWISNLADIAILASRGATSSPLKPI